VGHQGISNPPSIAQKVLYELFLAQEAIWLKKVHITLFEQSMGGLKSCDAPLFSTNPSKKITPVAQGTSEISRQRKWKSLHQDL